MNDQNIAHWFIKQQQVYLGSISPHERARYSNSLPLPYHELIPGIRGGLSETYLATRQAMMLSRGRAVAGVGCVWHAVKPRGIQLRLKAVRQTVYKGVCTTELDGA